MRRLSRWGWALLGFSATLLIAWGAATVWTLLKERSHERRITKIERVVLDPGGAHRAPRGGDASQPATAGQQPAPAPAGGKGAVEGGKASPHHVDRPPTATQAPGEETTEPAPEAPSTSPAPSAPSSEALEPPGLFAPALTTVCSVADRLVHLC
jgi:hypothetical protein